MNWTLTSPSGTPFEIANGVDRLHQVAAEDRGVMRQETPVDVYLEDTAPTAFLDQAIRSEELALLVTFPPCGSDAEAFMQARAVKAACPKGGVLRGERYGERVEYAQSWIDGVEHERIGVTNLFTFQLTVTRPQMWSWYADEGGGIYTDENNVPYQP